MDGLRYRFVPIVIHSRMYERLLKIQHCLIATFVVVMLANLQFCFGNPIQQQIIDHFGNDDRAMSPRSWGNYFNQPEPRLPNVTFDSGPSNRPVEQSKVIPKNQNFRQVESSRMRSRPEYFETQPLLPGRGPKLESNSSPIPLDDTPVPFQSDTSQAAKSTLEHRPAQPLISSPDSSGFGETRYGRFLKEDPAVVSEFPMDVDYQYPGCRNCERRVESRWGYPDPVCQFCVDENWFESDECVQLKTKFNPILGHRYDFPLTRGNISSSVEKFSFEEDGEFPPASEILAQSIFFAELDSLFLQPSFQDNTAIVLADGNNFSTLPFNFDLESSFRVMGGFESDYGPGFAGEYFQFDRNSDDILFVSDGVLQGTVNVNQLDGFSVINPLVAGNLGESILSSHSLEVHSTSVYAFKAIKFKRAYVNGRFGLQIVSVENALESQLRDAGGNLVGVLNQESNLEAFGPRFGIDYVRKIGHTPAQLIASSTTSLLFGERDQIIENTANGQLFNLGTDEFITVIDIFFGVQSKKIRGEKRNLTFRVGFVNQVWFGGGTAVDPNGNFGFQGISITAGFNR